MKEGELLGPQDKNIVKESKLCCPTRVECRKGGSDRACKVSIYIAH